MPKKATATNLEVTVEHQIPADAGLHRTTTRSGIRGRFFFVGISVALLTTVVVGFSRTFYLKEYFDAPTLPWYVHVHGVVLTSWFALLVVQAWLVATDRTRTHRRLGYAGVAVAVLVVVSAVAVQVTRTRRLFGELYPGLENLFLMLAAFGQLTFAGMVGVAVYARRHADEHKRLMTLATISAVTAAVLRLPGLEVIPLALLPFLPCLFVAALAVNDLVTRGRVLRVTLLGACIDLAWRLLAVVLAGTRAPQALAGWIAS